MTGTLPAFMLLLRHGGYGSAGAQPEHRAARGLRVHPGLADAFVRQAVCLRDDSASHGPKRKTHRFLTLIFFRIHTLCGISLDSTFRLSWFPWPCLLWLAASVGQRPVWVLT